MDPTYLRILGVGGILVVAVLATGGAIVLSWLVTRVVQAGQAVTRWLARLRTRPAKAPGRTAEASGTLAVDAGPADGLVTRQAWRRLRC